MNKPLRKKYPPVRNVSALEHVEIVKEIFATITPKYDFLNHVMSLRRDVAWRRFSAKKMRFFDANRMLDVATGTGDLAVAVASEHPDIRVIGLDFVVEMLCAGFPKTRMGHLSGRIDLLGGDALNLPFHDNSFDVAAIAFGIRNVPDKIRALEEMARVVVPGGQVMVLEMTFPRNGPLKWLWRVYLNGVLPCMGRLFSPNPQAYRYLGDSIMNFPTPDRLARLMEKAGLFRIQKYPLTLGITQLHIGTKPE